jgi:hypothetical protein
MMTVVAAAVKSQSLLSPPLSGWRRSGRRRTSDLEVSGSGGAGAGARHEAVRRLLAAATLVTPPLAAATLVTAT